MATCSLPGDRSNRTDQKVLQKLDGFEKCDSFLQRDLPERSGPRPECENCLPHAQMDQQSSAELFEKLKERALSLLGKHVTVGKSTVSMPSTFPAFHLVCQECNSNSNSTSMMPVDACMTPGGPTCGSEFAHVHARYYSHNSTHALANNHKRWQEWQGGGQGSMHLCLTLKDAGTVLEKNWGERHLLAGGGDDSSPRPPGVVPNGLVLVYSPRTPDELEVSLKILQASFLFAQSRSS
jgi:hypothetical protein